MVQLKAENPMNDDTSVADFNSSMVQLKEGKYLTAYEIEKFQFLYGTIKSWPTALGGGLMYFNSSMVQLKERQVLLNVY